MGGHFFRHARERRTSAFYASTAAGESWLLLWPVPYCQVRLLCPIWDCINPSSPATDSKLLHERRKNGERRAFASPSYDINNPQPFFPKRNAVLLTGLDEAETRCSSSDHHVSSSDHQVSSSDHQFSSSDHQGSSSDHQVSCSDQQVSSSNNQVCFLGSSQPTAVLVEARSVDNKHNTKIDKKKKHSATISNGGMHVTTAVG